MGKRIDYFDEPAALPANSVKPSATTFVLRDGAVLLTCRSDDGNWSMPGGAHDPRESLSMTAVRDERRNRYRRDPHGCRWNLHRPHHIIHYTSNDEVRQEFTVVYRADYVSGEPTPDQLGGCSRSRIARVDRLPAVITGYSSTGIGGEREVLLGLGLLLTALKWLLTVAVVLLAAAVGTGFPALRRTRSLR